MSESMIHRMSRIKSRKKRIAVRLLIGFLALYSIYSAIVWVRAANCKIFIEQREYTGIEQEPEIVEVVSLKDRAMILKMFDKRHITKYRGIGLSSCVYGGITFAIVKTNGKTMYFSPTSCCNGIYYRPDGGRFAVFGIEKYRLNKLLERHSFPKGSY